MSASYATYTRFEMLRLLRNRQNLVFSVVFPIVMYFLLAGPNKDNHNFGGTKGHPTGLFAPQYYMVSLLAFGGMVAVLSGGARIAAERTVGWNRLLRLTPLSAAGYLRTQGAHRLPDGRDQHRRCSTPPASRSASGCRSPAGSR